MGDTHENELANEGLAERIIRATGLGDAPTTSVDVQTHDGARRPIGLGGQLGLPRNGPTW